MKPRLSDALLAAQTDERLVALTRAGHERAFAAIVERYRRPLVGFARRIAPDSRAEDVVQQALTSAWAALAAGAEVAHLRGWLHQIVRHEAIRLAKQEGRAIVDPLEGEQALARGAAEEAAERERVRDAFAGIAELPASQREALVQTTLVGRSRSEVAAALGLSEGAVRQLVHRARTSLRTAATALTPLPLATWAASPRSGDSAGVAAKLAAGSDGAGSGLAASLGGGSGHGLAEAAAGAGGATLAGVLSKAGVAVVATGAIAGGVTVTEHRRHQQPPAQTQQARGAGAAGPPTVRAAGEPAASGGDLTGAPASAATPIAFGGADRGGVRRDRDGRERGGRGPHRDGGAGPERDDGSGHGPVAPAPATPSPPQPAAPSGGRQGGGHGRPDDSSHAAPSSRRGPHGGSRPGSSAPAREEPQHRDRPRSETHRQESPERSPARSPQEGGASSGGDGSRGDGGSSGRSSSGSDGSTRPASAAAAPPPATPPQATPTRAAAARPRRAATADAGLTQRSGGALG